MKTIIRLLFGFLIILSCEAQNPADTLLQSGNAENRIKSLEAEILRLNNSVSNLTNLQGMISKSFLDMEDKLKQQGEEISLLKSKMEASASGLPSQPTVKKYEIISNPVTESDSIIQVIQLYAKGASVPERLPYILQPERVGRLMEEFYTNGVKAFEVPRESVKINGSGFANGQVFTVNREGEDELLYIQKTADGYKIDWEAFKGYNPISLKLYQINQEMETRDFRVLAKLNGNGLDGVMADLSDYQTENWWSLQLSDRQSGYFIAYVEKNSPAGIRIYNLLKDMNFHPLFLRITPFRIKNKFDDEMNIYYRVSSLLANGWAKK